MSTTSLSRRPTTPLLTVDGRRALQERADRLRLAVIPELGAMIGDPEHDRRIDEDYGRAYAELLELDSLLAEAGTVESGSDAGVVSPGARVLVEIDGRQEWFRLVHPLEAVLDDERVSWGSPLAQALMGLRPGETASVRAPRGTWTCRVVQVA